MGRGECVLLLAPQKRRLGPLSPAQVGGRSKPCLLKRPLQRRARLRVGGCVAHGRLRAAQLRLERGRLFL
jgi:hypothetical protein